MCGPPLPCPASVVKEVPSHHRSSKKHHSRHTRYTRHTRTVRPAHPETVQGFRDRAALRFSSARPLHLGGDGRLAKPRARRGTKTICSCLPASPAYARKQGSPTRWRIGLPLYFQSPRCNGARRMRPAIRAPRRPSPRPCPSHGEWRGRRGTSLHAWRQGWSPSRWRPRPATVRRWAARPHARAARQRPAE